MTLEKLKHEKRTACLRREDVKSAHFPLFPLCRSRGFTSKGENQRRRKIQTRNDFIYFVYLIYLKLFVLSLQSCFLSCAVAVVLLLCFDFVLSSKTFQINTIYTLKRLRICLLVCFQEQQEGTFWCVVNDSQVARYWWRQAFPWSHCIIQFTVISVADLENTM